MNTPIGFEVSGKGEFKILVTDLAPGTWQVLKDGAVLIPAVEVAEDAGVLYLDGPAGRYSLLR